MKESTSYFSYRYFSSKAEIKSPVFLKLVIEGERNLTPQMTSKFVTALGLSGREETFFRNLVKFNQAKTTEEKQEHYAVLLAMNEYVSEHRLSAEQYRYYNKWYYAAVRELITLAPYGDDYVAIAENVHPVITKKEAKDAVELLCSLGLIERKGDSYYQTEQSITGGTDILNLARRKHNSDMIERALFANKTISPEERNISGVTLGISPECYDMVVAEMQSFKERIKTIVAGDEESNRVYQLNLQLFPLSNEVKREEGHE